MTATRSTFTEAEQAYYNTLDEAVTTGRVERVGPASHRDGSPVNPDELDEILRGRPALGHDRATGAGRSPRRQVRLPADTNAALDAYAQQHGTTASAVIRTAVETYLATQDTPAA